MKVQLRITISDIMEVDSDHYEGDTPEDIASEQEKFFEDGASDPGECIGFSDDYSCTVEVVGASS